MNNIQNYGIMSSPMLNFKANPSKAIGEVAQKTASKSGIYQAAVDKLAALQGDIEYSCALLRINNWFNPANVRESDKAVYDLYQSKMANLKKQKKEVIDEMIKQVKQDDRYKNLSDECIDLIREHIDCGSTWPGFYFNDESINKILARMK